MSTYIVQANEYIRQANEVYRETPFKKGEYEDLLKKAISCCDQEIKNNGENGEVYLKMGEARLLLNDKVGACQDFEKAKDLGHPRASHMLNKNCKQ